jgi:hypothetical protein
VRTYIYRGEYLYVYGYLHRDVPKKEFLKFLEIFLNRER